MNARLPVQQDYPQQAGKNQDNVAQGGELGNEGNPQPRFFNPKIEFPCFAACDWQS